MKKFFAKLWKSLLVVVYILLATVTTLLSGCESLTPTRRPPLAEKIGYNIPDFKGWTTTGINDAVYNMEVQKLKLLASMINLVNVPALQARKQAVDWLNVGMSAGLFGGLPLALRRIPKGAVKKEDHEKRVAEAGLQDPEDFKKQTKGA